MAKPFVDDWIAFIRPLFPKSSRIEIDVGKDVVVRVDWKLRNDPGRPNKRSRLIRVVIPEETIQDCPDVKTVGSRIKKLIQYKLSLFNPDHDTRKCGRRPVEEWVVSTFDVN